MAKKRPEREGIMLCYPTDEGRVTRLGKVILGQPKYNGERAHIEWFADEPFFISSYGNEFKFLDHLKEPIANLRKSLGCVPFDGEIYVHGWSRERIDSALRRTVNKSPDVEGLQYHIFDLKSQEPNFDRAVALQAMKEKGYFGGEDSPLRLVPTIGVTREDWMEWAVKFVEAGYEGIILRKPDAPWVARRTVTMLKFKPTKKDHYLILSVNEAIDQYGKPKGMIGSFTVKAKDTEESFKVGAGKMKHPRRIELWKLKHMLPGKMLEVKHELLKTSGDVPLCAVAVEVQL